MSDLPAEIKEQLLDPFVAALTSTLREWAGAESAVQATHGATLPPADLWATLELTFPTRRGLLALGLGAATAAGLARRVLAEVPVEVNDDLVRDCVGELANLTAGQAKALLHGTAYRLTFATPKITTENIVWPARESFEAYLTSELGDFVLRISLA